MSVLEKPKEDRPWWKRMTILAVGVWSAVQAAEATGQLPPGTTEAGGAALGAIAVAAEKIALVLGTLGIYRQVAN